MVDELAGLVMEIAALLLLVSLVCIKFWGKRAAAGRVDVKDEPNRSRLSEASDVLYSESGSAAQAYQKLPCQREQKVVCKDCVVAVAGAERQPFADMIFRLYCNRYTIVQLILDQVDFGVRNCCTGSCAARGQQQCDRSCKTVFIHKVKIQVRPKSWAQDCRRVLLHPYHTPEIFGLQRSSNLSVQMPLVCPRQASITHQTGSTVSRAAPTFAWSPAQKDPENNAVSWTWELTRHANGKKLEFNKFRWGRRPVLGIWPSHMQCHPESFKAEASWELEPNIEIQMQLEEQLEWDVKVDFGVRNHCTGNCATRDQQQCDRSCKTVLIHKVTIQVRPKSWAQDCRRVLLQPYHTAEIFGLQRSSNLSVQMPLVCARQASITYQTGSTVSRAAPTFAWSPAQKDPESNAVTWTWELKRHANGKKLEFNRFRWGRRPLLGLPLSHMQCHPESFKAEASWELEPNNELQVQLEWDVKVILHTAVVESKRHLPGYSITEGPTLTFEKLLAFSTKELLKA